MGPKGNEYADRKISFIKKETHACKYCDLKFRTIGAHRIHETKCSKK